MTIWISALIPVVGADTYDGVRLQASFSEAGCYRDLAEWLEIRYRGVKATIAALDKATDESTAEPGFGIRSWKVEQQEVAL